MNGAQQIQQLDQAGFSQDDIAKWSTDQRARLTSAGFGETEVNAWFGAPREPNLKPIEKLVRDNLKSAGATDEAASAAGTMAQVGADQAGAVAAAAVQPAPVQRTGTGEPEPSIVAKVAPKPARSFDEALTAGLQLSVTGLMGRGQMPSKVLAEDAPMASRIAANVGTVVGDLPWMAAGLVLGGGAGIETGPGAVVTGGAGALGLPAGMRATLIDSYRNGDFKSFGDFWERSSGIIWETIKGEITGAFTAGAGVAAKVALPAAAPAIVRATVPTAAEIATMTTVGRALEGHAPTAQDFMDAAVLLGGMKVAGATPALVRRLQDAYVRTGVKPTDMLTMAERDPTALPELLADNAPGAEPAAPKPPANAPEAEATAPQKAVLDRISVGEGEARSYSWGKFYAQMKDELYPLAELRDQLKGDKPLATSEDFYKLARETRGLAGKAQQFLELSPFKFDTYENVGKPLEQIVEPVKKDLDGLRAYAVARRAVELEGRGIQTGVPMDEARAVIAQGGKFEQPFKELLDYQGHLVDYLVDSGVLRRDQAAAMREANKDYVPFFRLMGTEAGPGGVGPGMSVRSPIKSIKGSERKVIDPLESIVKNTYVYTALAERNAVGTALYNLWEKAGKPDIAKEVAAPAKAIEVGDKELQRFLDAHGIDGEAEAFTIFRRGVLNPSENHIVFFRNGQRTVLEVPKDVAGAFNATDRETAGALMKILAFPARTLRAGATLAPDFMLRNLNRDQLSAAVFSDNNYVPMLDFMRGFMSLAKKDQEFQLWLKSGGANATMLSMDRQYLQSKVNDLADLQTVKERVWNAVKAPIELLRITSELVENATRLGEFKKGLGGETTKAAAQEAAFGAREVTLDFARIGAKTRGVNMITAFWNAQVEGVDRTVRAFKDNPLRTSIKVAAYITTPSVLLWWANHDDPRWKEIPAWERDLFWIVMTKDHIYRIPKPFELGVLFGSLPERLLDKFKDDKPDAFNAFGKSVANTFGVNMVPTAAAPLLEQITNHSFFTDRPLIPHVMEGILPEYQYSPYTTETTKALGHIIGAVPGMRDQSIASPIVIDNYVRGWTGTLGTYAVQIADAALRKAGVVPDPIMPAATLADLPVIKAFVVRHPSAQAQSIQDFHEHYMKAKQIVDTINYLARGGDAEAAAKVAQMDPIDMVKLDGISHGLGNAQRVIQLVVKNPNFSPDEKRQLVDNTYAQMITMAQSGEETLLALKKTLKFAHRDVEAMAVH